LLLTVAVRGAFVVLRTGFVEPLTPETHVFTDKLGGVGVRCKDDRPGCEDSVDVDDRVLAGFTVADVFLLFSAIFGVVVGEGEPADTLLILFLLCIPGTAFWVVSCFDISVDTLSALQFFRAEELLPRKLAARGPCERCRVELNGLYVETFSGNAAVEGLMALGAFLTSTGVGFVTEVADTPVLGIEDIFVVCRGDLKVLKSLLMLVLGVLLTAED
jgi:hypothetical protein